MLAKVLQKKIIIIIFSILIILSFLTPISFGLAADTDLSHLPLPEKNLPNNQPYQDNTGRWIMPDDGALLTAAPFQQVQISDQQDHFGYSVDETLPVEWIDATGGNNTNMVGGSAGQAYGPVDLGFTFPYYENSYTKVSIAASGYVSFDDGDYWPNQSQIPAVGEPNNVIAPYWAPLFLSETGPDGQVYYLQGGAAPERYFVVEWAGVAGGPPADPVGGNDHFHFQLILYENGDIRFQYHQMLYEGHSYCGAAGIEDATGEDGLNVLPFCAPALSDHAVLFTRPEPAARMRVSPVYQSGFISPGENGSFRVTIRNIGDFGKDTFDLILNAKWQVELLGSDGTTPLTDTNDSGFLDTGAIIPGESRVIVIKVFASENLDSGDNDRIEVVVSSSVNPEKKQTVTIQAAVPSRFGQVYRDDADGAMRLQLASPTDQLQIHATSGGWWGYNQAVAETQDGNFFYVWQRWRLIEGRYSSEIESTLISHAGEILIPAARLIDHSPEANSILDEEPVIAVAPNGTIGVAWRRRIQKQGVNGTQENWNVFFALLNNEGQVERGPVNITQNDSWYDENQINNGVPRYWDIRIATNRDNGFGLTWHTEIKEESTQTCPDQCKYDDIYFAALSNLGEILVAPTRITQDFPSRTEGYFSPTIQSLPNNRWFVVYNHLPGGLAFVVLDSQGNLIRGRSFIGTYGWSPVVEPLVNSDSIVIAWTAWTSYRPQVHVIVLNSKSYQKISGPHIMINPLATTGGDYPSLVSDSSGRAILTWMDFNASNRRHLYYALIDENGLILTPPMVYQSALTEINDQPTINVGLTGYSSTTNRQFLDVPVRYWAAGWIEWLFDSGITKGCQAEPPLFCPRKTTTRAEMAVLMIRAIYGPDFEPPEVEEPLFADVDAGYWAAPWIEQLYRDGLTKGCAKEPLRYCPTDEIRRDQMAVFLVRMIYGPDYVPPEPTGLFVDVDSTHWATRSIEQLYRDEITTGCSTVPLRFCPKDSTSRAQIAVFLGRSFGLSE